ncbi:MAG: MoaD/ThiS family protein [Flavobacteriales bacterium]|nr:MoaD/ThiS family protein [Flavobacteriales bacterium]
MKVIYYGIIQEKIGLEEETLQCLSTDEMMSRLIAKYPFLKEITCTLFKNQIQISGNEPLIDTDELVICPPFSGG